MRDKTHKQMRLLEEREKTGCICMAFFPITQLLVCSLAFVNRVKPVTLAAGNALCTCTNSIICFCDSGMAGSEETGTHIKSMC